MNIHSIDKNQILNIVKQNTSESRFEHTLRVADLATKLAHHYKVDADKTWLAAVLHDLEKNISLEENDDLVNLYGLDKKYLGNKNLSHSKLAAAVSRDKLGIDDEDILNAIAFHTTGRSDMSMLEKIIFVADTCEEGRTYKEAALLREKAFENIDDVCIFILEYLKESIEKKGLVVDEDTIQALRYLKEKRD